MNMPEVHGIKESKEVIHALKEVAVLIYKAQKGSASIQETAGKLPVLVMQNPHAVQAVKDAFDNAGLVPAEAKDLSWPEAAELFSYAAQEVARGKAEADA